MKKNNPAFPYRPLPKKITSEFEDILSIKEPLKDRCLKLVFDKVAAFCLIFILSPLYLVILIGYFIDGIVHKEHRGLPFASYEAVSRGKTFYKYKFRLTYLLPKSQRKGDIPTNEWYADERKPGNLNNVGKLLKNRYLDELPQIFNILKGDMSFVGPRALATEHFKLDVAQGNNHRAILKAGIFSYTHSNKGTKHFYETRLNYVYVREYMQLSPIGLLLKDLKIIFSGIKMILEGKGY